MSNTELSIAPSRPRGKLRAYDHAAFYPTMRPADLFLCSYPKSGTTWLGFLLAQILKADADEQLGLDSFNQYVPDVNLNYTKRGTLVEYSGLPDPRFFLCHATFDANLPKVIYVLRDPRDVMVSYWHYQKLLSADFNQSLGEYLRSDTHWPCEWDEHVASWLLPRRHPNLLVVRYEDLHTRAPAILREVLDMAGVKCEPARIDAAVEASRFARMRAAEERFGVANKSAKSQERFIRKGRVGGWREEMSDEDVKILQEKYGEVLREVGYELSR
jgi:hypothetical protein